MRKYLFVIGSLFLILLSCSKDTQQQKERIDKPIDDSKVLMPPNGYSALVRVTNNATAKPPKNSVTGLTATVLSSYSIKLNWNPVNRSDWYKIYRNGLSYNSTSSLEFTDGGLTPNTMYYYQVSSIVNGVEGTLSSPVSATTFPSAAFTNVVYLNFNGDTVTSYRWGLTNAIMDASGLTITEQQRIVDSVKVHFLEVSDKIIVTTDRSVYDNADIYHRQKTIITQTNWYGFVGGVSFRNTFSSGDSTPNFVFPVLLQYNIEYLWSTVCHEDGHAFGLFHAVNVCGEISAEPFTNSNGVTSCQFMGGLSANMKRYFQTPELCLYYGTPDMDQNCTTGVNEYTIIKSKL